MEDKTKDHSTRERLIEAAGKLFAEKGYKETTVREICELADANVAAVNYHFGDKLMLLREVVLHVIEEFKNVPLAELVAAEKTPEDKIFVFIRSLLKHRFGSGQPEWAGEFFGKQLMESPDFIQSQMSETVGRNFMILGGIISEVLGPDAHEEKVRRTIFSVVGQFLVYFIMHTPLSPMPEGIRLYINDDNLDDFARHIARFSMAGIKAVGENE